MRRLVSSAIPLAVLLLSAIPTLAQERSAELQRLDYWVGEWTGTEDGTMACKWLGNSFVHCEAAGPDFAVLWVMEHNAEEGYKMTSFNNSGESGTINFSVQDDTWTWLFEIPTGGQFRMTWVMESKDVMTLTGEMAVEGGEWVVEDESRMTRVR